ncbi:MAG: choline dehydrogenase-like flavoprotein [Myxococcota bacterium]|jgi:choline dehydrogenase-like flavoprotein
MSGRIVQGADITSPQELTCDVCIVGSGAGGSVLAARLAAEGLSVIVLEEGGYYARPDFDLNLGSAFDRLYQDGGRRATDDLSITVLQGRSIGGSTTINWTTCYRTPDRILDHWRDVHGVDTLNAEVLGPHWDRVEERLNIHRWEESPPNAHNSILSAGCEALDWEFGILKRNVKGCGNTGYCGHGCPLDAKQAMHVTFIPDACRSGAVVYADVRADRYEVTDGRVVAVHASVMDRLTKQPTGTTVTVRPKIAVTSGGAINSPALLIRSDITQGPVGKRTFLHPVVAVVATYDHDISPWAGAPQSVASHQFIDRGDNTMGCFLEVPPMHPMLASVSSPLFGDDEAAFMENLKNTGTLIALHIDGLVPGDEGGTVTVDANNRIRVNYPLTALHQEAFQFSHERMAEVHFAAGAIEVMSLHGEPLRMTDPSQVPQLGTKSYGAHEHPIFTAHQMGGCAMGPDPATSVVDTRLKHHHIDNLYVVDGSVFPTALGVNPSQTIYGIASWAAVHIAEAAR